MQANAAAKKQQLLEAQARAQAEAQAAADAMIYDDHVTKF